MDAERALRLSSRAVALSGLLSLYLTGEAAYWLLLPASAVAAMGFLSRLSGPVLSPRTVTALTVLFAAFAVADFFYISGSLILAGADFLVLLLCLKLLSLERQKDYIQLYAVSFFILLASTGLSTDIYFLAAFLLFFISLTWALILLTIKGEAGGGQGRVRLRLGRLFFAGTAGLTILATLFTAVIFLVIPRVGVGYFSRKAGGLMKSGFSDRVELSSGGELLLDPAAVMRVGFPGMDERPEGPLYFRGKVFDTYNGHGWEGSAPARRQLLREPDGGFHTEAGRGMRSGVVQEITLEPLDSPVLFSMYPAIKISGDVRAVFEDDDGALYLKAPPDGRVRYTVYSANPGILKSPSQVTPLSSPLKLRGERGGLKGGKGGFEELASYLRLPDGSGNIGRLAAEAAGQEEDPLRKAQRLEKYIRDNYKYSLDPPQAQGGSALEGFLFGAKTGYCVHFATAMALMLRSEGIPSRLVSGFMDGEWNVYGKYLLVRQQDAHTWVEAWLPGRGWTVFDPTPAAFLNRKNYFSGLLGAVDLLRYKWDRWVVFYSLRDQAGAARKVLSAYQAAKQRVADADRKLRFTVKIPGLKEGGKKLAFLPVFISMAVLAAVLGRMYLRKAMNKNRTRTRVEFYEEALAVMRKNGFSRRPGETPLEFAAGLAARAEVAGPFNYLTEAYNRVRFGSGRLGPGEKKMVREALLLLKASLNDARYSTMGRPD